MTLREAELTFWCLGAIGLIATGAGWILESQLFPSAWLAATICWIGWPLGCMGLVLIHSLTGGSWGYALRPPFAAGISTLAITPLVAVPLVIAAPSLYPWLQPAVSQHLDNGFYLNQYWFLIRCAVYLFVWFGVAWSIFRSLRENVDTNSLKLAPLGLILLALTVTFASVDFIEALDPKFASSVFGLMTIVEMGLFALAVSVAAATFMGGERTAPTLGQLTLALTILWAYLDFMQLLIVWQSNLPREAAWYVVRWRGGWGVVGRLVLLLHFILPFALLLSSRARTQCSGLLIVAGLLIVGGVLRCWWLVLPAASASMGFTPFASLLAIWGVALGWALRARIALRFANGVVGNA